MAKKNRNATNNSCDRKKKIITINKSTLNKYCK